MNVVRFLIGRDVRLPDGRQLIGEPLSPLFHEEAVARQALAEIKYQHPDARLIRVTDLEANEAGEHG